MGTFPLSSGLARSHLALDVCGSPEAVPTVILGALLSRLSTGAPALKYKPLAPASTIAVLWSVLHAGGSGIASSCPQSLRHAQGLISGCTAAPVAAVFCKAASSKNKFSLLLAIWVCNPFSLDCHFLFARFSFILVLHRRGDTPGSSLLSKREVFSFRLVCRGRGDALVSSVSAKKQVP